MITKFVFCFCCLLFPLMLFGQGLPSWVNDAIRERDFPSNMFYAAFISEGVASGETSAQTNARLENAAKREISESIRVKVKSGQTINERSSQNSGTNSYQSLVQEDLQTSSDAEIVGIKTETYFNKITNKAYAFAYVSKADLKNYYQKQISLWLNKVDGALQTASELVAKGYKMKARQQCESVKNDFASIFYAQNLLTAVDGQANDNILQQSRSERLRNILVQTLTELETSISIYVEYNETANGQTVTYIADRLPGMLTEQDCGCNFTDLKDEADYAIKVNTHLDRCNDAPDNLVFCYANATVSVYNAHTQQTLMPKIEESKGGWTNGNNNKATEEAFNGLVNKIAEKVMQTLKK